MSFLVKRQSKEKILSKIAQTTMVNRSRMRDVGDTRQDYEELDSAINSGLYLKDVMNRQGEDFYYTLELRQLCERYSPGVGGFAHKPVLPAADVAGSVESFGYGWLHITLHIQLRASPRRASSGADKLLFGGIPQHRLHGGDLRCFQLYPRLQYVCSGGRTEPLSMERKVSGDGVGKSAWFL